MGGKYWAYPCSQACSFKLNRRHTREFQGSDGAWYRWSFRGEVSNAHEWMVSILTMNILTYHFSCETSLVCSTGLQSYGCPLRSKDRDEHKPSDFGKRPYGVWELALFCPRWEITWWIAVKPSILLTYNRIDCLVVYCEAHACDGRGRGRG
jgi:hypothetical protein